MPLLSNKSFLTAGKKEEVVKAMLLVTNRDGSNMFTEREVHTGLTKKVLVDLYIQTASAEYGYGEKDIFAGGRPNGKSSSASANGSIGGGGSNSSGIRTPSIAGSSRSSIDLTKTNGVIETLRDQYLALHKVLTSEQVSPNVFKSIQDVMVKIMSSMGEMEQIVKDASSVPQSPYSPAISMNGVPLVPGPSAVSGNKSDGYIVPVPGKKHPLPPSIITALGTSGSLSIPPHQGISASSPIVAPNPTTSMPNLSPSPADPSADDIDNPPIGIRDDV